MILKIEWLVFISSIDIMLPHIRNIYIYIYIYTCVCVFMYIYIYIYISDSVSVYYEISAFIDLKMPKTIL